QLEEMLTRPDRARGERDASDVEGPERRAASGADLAAENVRLGDLAVFEDELAGVGATKAHLVVDLPDAESLEALFHDEAADPTARALRAVVRGIDDDHIGDRTIGHPDLRTVQDPAAIPEGRARLDGGRVG